MQQLSHTRRDLSGGTSSSLVGTEEGRAKKSSFSFPPFSPPPFSQSLLATYLLYLLFSSSLLQRVALSATTRAPTITVLVQLYTQIEFKVLLPLTRTIAVWVEFVRLRLRNPGCDRPVATVRTHAPWRKLGKQFPWP